MFRSIFLPVLLMGMIGGPILYSHHQRRTANLNNAETQTQPQVPWQTAGYRDDGSNVDNVGTSAFLSNEVSGNGFLPPNGTSAPATYFPPRIATTSVPVDSNAAYVQTGQSPIPAPPQNAIAANYSAPPAFAASDNEAWNRPGMVADVAKTETMVFPGDANGPDLTAQPLSNTPTIDLSSLFRFDVTEQSITTHWDRVSTCPSDQGLHGMRVALVTGTNSWDLHGSLTYYFDANHRVQRITYRGWTGDASRLLQTLQQSHQLQPRPTHWAGLFLSKRSGLLMKHPAVIEKSNPVQQLALILEINNPRGNTPLSNDFRSLLPAATVAQ